jgi:hypothetical protein
MPTPMLCAEVTRMNEQRPNATPKLEPVDKDHLQPPVHGDKLDDAVVRVARGTKPARDPKDLQGDEIME